MIQDGVIINGVVYESKPCKVKQPRDWSDRCKGCAFSDPHKNFCHANTICFYFERLGDRPYQMYILQKSNLIPQMRKDANPIPIAKLQLSGRIKNQLHKNGIDNLMQLENISALEIMRMRWMGKRSVDELRREMSKYNVSFINE